jgi:cation:H+ antiporter
MLLPNLAYFAVACIFLAVSSIILVKLLKNIAALLKITDFAAAFIIMAAATSLPELFVGITSALRGEPALSFGNILGANMLDATLILGLIVIAAGGIKMDEKGLQRDSIFMLLMAMLPVILFIIGGSISRADGVILVSSFIAYSYFTARNRKRSKKKSEKKKGAAKAIFSIVFFLIFLFILFRSADSVVKYASALAIDFKLPAIVIGIFLVSIGTTMPELTFGVCSALLKEGEMGLGDQVGTVIFNSTFIVGVTALIHPITASFSPFIITSVFLLFASLLTIKFVKSGKTLTVKEGILLILVYAAFAIVSFRFNSF